MKVILSASRQPYCNVAVMCGGAKINGEDYFYVKEHDALMIRSVYGKYMKLRKKTSFNEFLGMAEKDDYTLEKKDIAKFKPNMFDGQ